MQARFSNGVSIANALSYLFDSEGYTTHWDEWHYALIRDLLDYVSHNFNEYIKIVLESVPHVTRHSVDVHVGSRFAARNYVSITDYYPVVYEPSPAITVIASSNNNRFQFDFPMAYEDVCHSIYALKEYVDRLCYFYIQHAENYNAYFFHDGVGRIPYEHITWGAPKPQNPRAEKLLLSQCDDAQKKQYKKHNWIIVYGHDTGTKYRIRHDSQINVDVLDGDTVLYRLCTVADIILNGRMPIEDNMLAQKTLIELNECEFLDKAIRWK